MVNSGKFDGLPVSEAKKGHRGIAPDTALRLAKLFSTSPDFWLNLQQAWDLYQAAHSKEAEVPEKIEPVTA